MNRFIKWLIGPSMMEAINDVMQGKQSLYMCDPVTATILVAAAIAGAGTASYSAQHSATKSAKSQADTQQRMVAASQEALVAKDAADKAELAQGIATAEAQAKGQVTQKKRAIARSETIYTSPLGIGGQADVSRKVLLGQ